VRPTTIGVSETWTLTAQAHLLALPTTRTLDATALTSERDRAFDLLDAVTRSGALPLEYCALHLMLASTQVFENAIMRTLVHDNINPIERCEATQLVIASLLHDVTAPLELARVEQRDRLARATPLLLPGKVILMRA